ncbi:MAG: hypothetical protein IPO09_09650 [Anaeromyxobacter sp.]|nr:hypothetical protein [Anaeromyxobacter sp.]MBL0278623.1 hypothetical protein [Anaeromyxobacter sp.]
MPARTTRRARHLAVAALLLLSAPSGRARAQVAEAPTAAPGQAAAGQATAEPGPDTPAEAAPPPALPRGQRTFGVGATLGSWAGAGLIAGGGGRTVKGWVTAGYAPVLVFSNARTASRSIRFNGYSAFQVGADLGVPLAIRERSEARLLLGYKYNTVLGHGGGAGVRLLYDRSAHLALAVAAGLTVFPAAERRLDEHQHYPPDRDPGLTPALQGGLTLELIWFP